MKKFVIIITLFGLLANLNASDKNLDITQNQWLQDLKVLVSLSDKNVYKYQILDKNDNGISDDIEEFILSKYEDDPFQRDMFFKAANKIQKILNLPIDTAIDKRVKLDKELLGIYTCRDYILYRNKSEDIEDELLNKTLFKGKVLNTSNKLKTYIEHKKLLPLSFDELTKERLLKEKSSCLALYYSYEDDNSQSSIQIVDEGEDKL